MAMAVPLPPGAHWIDPDNLTTEFRDCICVLCFGVMHDPASGCPEGHTFCRECIIKEHHNRPKCPVCRFPKAYDKALTRNRPLQGVIAQLRVRCELGPKLPANSPEIFDGAGGKKLKTLTSTLILTDMTVPMLAKELADRSLMVSGSKASLVHRLQERLEKENFQAATCDWVGRVDEVLSHNSKCGWVKIPCTTTGCLVTPNRRDFDEHRRICTPIITCPNEGCFAMFQVTNAALHYAKCEMEDIICPGHSCGMTIKRHEYKKHVTDNHMTTAGVVMQMQRDTLRYNAWKSEMNYAQSKNHGGITDSTFLSTLIINWSCGEAPRYSDGWAPGPQRGVFRSEPHMFEKGGRAQCFMKKMDDTLYHVGVSFLDIGPCKLHLTFELLDNRDQGHRTVWAMGSENGPVTHDFTTVLSKGFSFSTDPREKTMCTRPNGSVRFRVVLRLFREKN